MKKFLLNVFGLGWIAITIYGLIVVINSDHFGIDEITFVMFTCFVMVAVFQGLLNREEEENKEE